MKRFHIVLFLFCLPFASALAEDAFVARLTTAHHQSPYRALTVYPNGSVTLAENGKTASVVTLPAEHVATLRALIDTLPPFELVDQTPGKPPCPGHFSSDYEVTHADGRRQVIVRALASCHRLGPAFPEGGAAGPQLTVYQTTNRLARALDLLNELYFNLRYGQ